MKTKKIDKRKFNKGKKGIAGRKSLGDKAIPVTVYIKDSRIEELGGIIKARETAKRVLQ